MPLTGQAKKDYQRVYMKDYMRNRRAGITVKTQAESVKTVTPILLRPVTPSVRPESVTPENVEPEMDADDNPIPEY